MTQHQNTELPDEIYAGLDDAGSYWKDRGGRLETKYVRADLPRPQEIDVEALKWETYLAWMKEPYCSDPETNLGWIIDHLHSSGRLK